MACSHLFILCYLELLSNVNIHTVGLSSFRREVFFTICLSTMLFLLTLTKVRRQDTLKKLNRKS
jgi:hypothetical protein